LLLVAMTKFSALIVREIGWSVLCQPAALRAVEILRLLLVHLSVHRVQVQIAAVVTKEAIREWLFFSFSDSLLGLINSQKVEKHHLFLFNVRCWTFDVRCSSFNLRQDMLIL
jgi:hypothetical protein